MAELDTIHYRITELHEGWVITHPSDNDLVWAGRFWADPEQRGSRPTTFDSESEAKAYAKQVFGE
jgi:hypothetical protein